MGGGRDVQGRFSFVITSSESSPIKRIVKINQSFLVLRPFPFRVWHDVSYLNV